MKKIIIPILALVIASCGGGNNQTQTPNSNAAADTTAKTTETTPQATADQPSTTVSSEPIPTNPPLYEILELISKRHNGLYARKKIHETEPELNTENHLYFVLNPGGDAMTCHDLDCFGIRGGGFLVNFHCDGYMVPMTETFVYQDGELTETHLYEYIQQPSINQFYANADKFPKPVYDFFVNKIESGLTLRVDEGKLVGKIDVWQEGSEGYELPAAIKGLEKKTGGDIVPRVKYIWNGEQFVLDPDYKPLTEDLKYFE